MTRRIGLAAGLLLAGCGAADAPTSSAARLQPPAVDGGVGGTPSGLGAEWTAKGETALRAGNVERARGAFERALRLEPRLERARLGMALVEMARLEYAAAARRTEGLGGAGASIHLQSAWLAGDLSKTREAAGGMGPTKGLNALIAELASDRARDPYRVAEGAREGSAPLATDAPLPVVEATIDGRAARLLVDTGAVETILDDSFGEGATRWIDELAIGSLGIRDVPAFVRDISPLAASLRTRIDGIIGLEILRRGNATLDYVEGWLLLRMDGPDSRAGASEVPFHVFRGRYLSIPVAIEGGQPRPFLLASGGTFAIGLTEGTLRATGRDPAALRPEADGIARYGVESVMLGGLTVTSVPAVHDVFPRAVADDAGVDFGGVVSNQLLAGFRVTFDTARRILAFEAPPESP